MPARGCVSSVNFIKIYGLETRYFSGARKIRPRELDQNFGLIKKLYRKSSPFFHHGFVGDTLRLCCFFSEVLSPSPIRPDTVSLSKQVKSLAGCMLPHPDHSTRFWCQTWGASLDIPTTSSAYRFKTNVLAATPRYCDI